MTVPPFGPEGHHDIRPNRPQVAHDVLDGRLGIDGGQAAVGEAAEVKLRNPERPTGCLEFGFPKSGHIGLVHRRVTGLSVGGAVEAHHPPSGGMKREGAPHDPRLVVRVGKHRRQTRPWGRPTSLRWLFHARSS